MQLWRSLFRSLFCKWKSYRHRFVPWVALNLARNRRTMRYVQDSRCDKLIPDTEVHAALEKLFRAIFLQDLQSQNELLCMLPEATKSTYRHFHAPEHQSKTSSESDVPLEAREILHSTLGFCIARAPSSIDSAGTGVFVSKGHVQKGAVVSMYPGTVYQQYEPIFFQSIRNPFIFRCIDGILIDGNDKGISQYLYRSCSRRDQLGPLKLCDATWLSAFPQNPWAVGQYVNNCSNEREANVCYQEFDVPEYFPIELRQYLPNINYSPDSQGPLRCVVLVALRDIDCGEELFSNYFTIVQ
ncbi:hypothetical protein XENTR_v10002925 [Xenopus tropicalis]|uniref:SET domain-containing 9 n=1 Tax=Xenopus tropicalis TaxID=8364 RepID=A0A6I8PW80_XENTR|nr:SET domain-containing protein 9 isoform X2 [Xenopus tropicalis]KAE8636290.1 hypothetical protein XENTR_v10002925 [Xenopus tropicalis]|eukprot:XP_002940280.1 PREDICTED: SET domain-containing protein 9 isoform X2 [Xenopus tropicalis]